MLSKNPVFGCREPSRYPTGLDATDLQTQPWRHGAAWTPARAGFARLAGDANYLCVFVTEVVSPGEQTVVSETREPALNLIQGPC